MDAMNESMVEFFDHEPTLDDKSEVRSKNDTLDSFSSTPWIPSGAWNVECRRFPVGGRRFKLCLPPSPFFPTQRFEFPSRP